MMPLGSVLRMQTHQSAGRGRQVTQVGLQSSEGGGVTCPSQVCIHLCPLPCQALEHPAHFSVLWQPPRVVEGHHIPGHHL